MIETIESVLSNPEAEAYWGMVNNETPTPVGMQTICGIFNEPWNDGLLDRAKHRTVLLDYVGGQYLATNTSDLMQHGMDFRFWRAPNMRQMMNSGGSLEWASKGRINCRIGGPAPKAVFVHGHGIVSAPYSLECAPGKDFWIPQQAESREQRYNRPIILEPGWGFAVCGAVNPHIFADFQWIERPITDAEWVRLQAFAAANP